MKVYSLDTYREVNRQRKLSLKAKRYIINHGCTIENQTGLDLHFKNIESLKNVDVEFNSELDDLIKKSEG